MHKPRAKQGLASDCDGNVAIIFSLSLPVLIGLAGLGVDGAVFYDQQTKMQNVADATALAVAKEMFIHLDELAALKEAGKSRAETLLAETGIVERPHVTSVRFIPEQMMVEVEIRMEAKGFLPAEVWGENPIVVNARAQGFGENLCVVGLDTSASGTLRLQGGSQIIASHCSVYSNSANPSGVRASDRALLEANRTCTAGGYEGNGSNFAPAPEVDCAVVPDPLEDRAPPPVGECVPGTHSYENTARRLSPGTYCGGLILGENTAITLDPGIYVIKDGPLVVGPGGPICVGGEEEDDDDGGGGPQCYTLDGGASLIGHGVAFYFTGTVAPENGKVSVMRFEPASVVELSAPTSGSMAGLLMFEDRAAADLRSFEVLSVEARELVGTIYLPRGKLVVNTDEAVSDESAYTAIIAKRLELSGAPELYLHTDYHATDVPVPAGLGSTSGAHLKD